MSQPIPFIRPNFPDQKLIAEDLAEIYKNNFYSNNGPFYYRFKNELQSYLGKDIHCVVVSNATLGLMMAIKGAFDAPSGEKRYIAIPSFTFAAAPHAIRWNGFEPIFFDVEVRDGQPSLSSFGEVVKLYGDKLAGVVLINNFGIGNSQIDLWDNLLNELNIPYIIDSAPGFGATYKNGEKIGGYGVCEVFSFHATKPFGIGEGGLITTRNSKLAERFERMKNFGFDSEKQVNELAINAKITELDCAIGLRVLAGYKDTLADRRRTYSMYERYLNEKVAFLPDALTSPIQFASIIVNDSVKRDKVLQALKNDNIEARTYYAPAVHTLNFFKDAEKVDLKNTRLLSSLIISLPVHAAMDEESIKRICDIITAEL